MFAFSKTFLTLSKNKYEEKFLMRNIFLSIKLNLKCFFLRLNEYDDYRIRLNDSK